MVAALAFQLPPPPGPLGPATPLPPTINARLAKPQPWRIQRVAPTPQPSDDVKKRSLSVLVGGKRVVLGPRDGFDYVDGVERGQDGSLLVHRTNRRVDPWEWRDDVWYQGEEKPVGALVYLDRNNHASFFIREEGTAPFLVRETAPEATAVRDGKPASLGWGWPKAWTPEGAIVLEVPVNDRGQPAGLELTSGTVTRILYRGEEWRVRDYDYLGRAKDGTLVFHPTRTGTIDPSKKPATDRALFWKDGRFVAHTALPPRWRIAGLAPEGWLLVRRRPVLKSLPPIPVENRKATDIVADFERRATSDDDPDTRAERDWTAGLLKDGVLTPIAFRKPKGTERLLWRGGAQAYGPRAFRFNAFWDDDDWTFRAWAK